MYSFSMTTAVTYCFKVPIKIRIVGNISDMFRNLFSYIVHVHEFGTFNKLYSNRLIITNLLFLFFFLILEQFGSQYVGHPAFQFERWWSGDRR